MITSKNPLETQENEKSGSKYTSRKKKKENVNAVGKKEKNLGRRLILL